MNAETEGQKQGGMRRRDVLLGTTTLAVAAASISSAHAQGVGTQPGAQPVTAAGSNKPNIIMTVSDDFGYATPAAIWAAKPGVCRRLTSTDWRRKA
jgi:hypothetical protein